jgi:hypothetical protein
MLRAVAFSICSVFILLAPAYPEFFHKVRKLRAVPDWQMFSTASLKVYEIRFETDQGSERRELDRFEALGFHNFTEAPRNLRNIASVDDAWSLARKLCRAGHSPLYMRLRKSDVCGRAASGGRRRSGGAR